MPKEQPIIIKKIKKKGGHGGHHGGAWKVAYADFVTAMMAFFMVLWLLAMLDTQTKDAMAVYFRSYSIFEGTGQMGGAGSGITTVLQGGPIRLDDTEGDINIGNSYRNLEMQLGGVFESELGGLRDQVLMVVTRDGIRIELIEKYGSPMFEAGNATLLDSGETILWLLAKALEDANVKISIEGHTDSSSSASETYSNWELSSDRANAARRALVEGGFDPEKIQRITGFADSALYNVNDPYDPVNRRVSILIIN